MADDIADLMVRNAIEWSRHSTHYAGCWRVHPMCMAMRVVDELVATRAAGEQLAAAIRRTPCDCSPTCTCGNLAALTDWENLNRD